MKVISSSPAGTEKAGMDFAASLKGGDIIGLKGELGSGKTQFVKGICEYFGVKDTVNSPTFVIVNEYEGKNAKGKIEINHFDLYRLNKVSDLDSLGLDRYINDYSICLIEWSDLMEEYLGKELKTVNFAHGKDEMERIIEIN